MSKDQTKCFIVTKNNLNMSSLKSDTDLRFMTLILNFSPTIVNWRFYLT